MDNQPTIATTTTYDPSRLNREELAEIIQRVQDRPNLTGLVDILRKVFESFEGVKLPEVLAALGPTGCGKSTIFNALKHGPDCLEVKTITEEMDIKGVKKKKKRKVIDLKDGIENPFKIGHSKAVSETMIPTIYPGKTEGEYFCDLAGFFDTRSEFIDIMN